MICHIIQDIGGINYIYAQTVRVVVLGLDFGWSLCLVFALGFESHAEGLLTFGTDLLPQ